jgi:oligopeptide/dipeptide ABC transporter ATP-binding protein
MYLGRIVEEGKAEEVFESALHPYSQMLREANPIPDPKLRKPAMRLEGEIASAANPPSGCHFHPRCPHKMEICTRLYPTWVAQAKGRGAACHLVSGLRQRRALPLDDGATV